jgi:Skp family chaperone for outer membrane proteins
MRCIQTEESSYLTTEQLSLTAFNEEKIMSMKRTFFSSLALAACLAVSAHAESTAASAGSTGAEKQVSSPARQGEAAPKERAAFRWESSSERIQKAQEALNKHGSNLKVDGVMGETTRDELRRYQRNNKLTETGRIDEATAKSLGIETK